MWHQKAQRSNEQVLDVVERSRKIKTIKDF